MTGTPSFGDVLELKVEVPGTYTAPFTEPQHAFAYGGQFAAQALMAAAQTVPSDKAPHSAHVHFLRRGDATSPVRYRVREDYDGRSYSTRSVAAEQAGRIVVEITASFHRGDDSPDVASVTMPAFDPPHSLSRADWTRPLSTDVRHRQGGAEPQYPVRFWARSLAELGSDRLLNAVALLYISDTSMGLSDYFDERIQRPASIDHTVWFHRPALLDNWTLFDLQPRSVSHGRGLYFGSVFSQTGELVASLAQEMVFRSLAPPSDSR